MKLKIFIILLFSFIFINNVQIVMCIKPDWIENFEKYGYSVIENNDEFTIKKGDFICVGGKEDAIDVNAKEIFLYDDYNLEDDKNKYIMFDIGLNIGMASIFSANKPNIEHIYGFEPFISTFQKAQKNIKLNPNIANKITIFNYGLSDKDKELMLHYNKNSTNCMRTIYDKFEDEQDTIIEKIQLKKASSIINEIIKKNPGKKVFLKFNCEGAEHEIINNLAEENLLKDIDIIIGEMHFKSPEKLKENLLSNGFVCFFNTYGIGDNKNLGMFRAINVKKYM